jgi:tryptophan synthase beta chain
MTQTIKYQLNESDMPRQWYNIVADMPNKPAPALHPGTGQPAGPQDFAPLFPMNIIEQEVSTQRWIDIPEPVLAVYAQWRPSPLYRARSFEQALGTPAKIYFKYEGVSPSGSHKTNSAVAQVYYNKQAGTKRITTETGAGQWGSALSYACNIFGIPLKVYMVKISFEQKPYRKNIMQVYGAEVVPSPTNDTNAGRAILAQDPNSLGSLGIAISEAVEDAAPKADTKYTLGSVLNHVLLHQTIIGLEAQKQFKLAGEYPDIVIGCCGGGSNFAGIASPFLSDKFAGKQVRCVGVEPAACPTLTKGHFHYDFGDAVCTTPLMPMYTLGHDFAPAGIHAGGLRYHGMAPIISQLKKDNLIEAYAYNQTECFKDAITFARAEGIIPAPESSHAIRHVVVEAQRAKEEGKERVILFNLSGHGHFDMSAYEKYLSGAIVDVPLPQSSLDASWEKIKGLPPIA